MQIVVLCLLFAASLVIAQGQSWEDTERSDPKETVEERVKELCEKTYPQPESEEYSQKRAVLDDDDDDDDHSGSAPAWFEKFLPSNFHRNQDSTEDGDRKRRHVDVNIVEVLGPKSSSKINVLHDEQRKNVSPIPWQTTES